MQRQTTNLNPNYAIGFAQTSDLPEILAIYNHEITSGTANWNDQTRSLAEYQAWFQQLQDNHFPLLVIIDRVNKRIAGYGYYSWFREHSGYRFSVEHSIYIHTAHQKKGLGKALLAALIDSAQQQNFHVMVGAIDSTNRASIALHQKFGFVQTGYMPQIGIKHNTWRDLVLMQRDLASN